MKRITKLCSIATLICSMYIHAQHPVTGFVKDAADGSAVSYATVALLLPDSSLVTGVITNDEGRFTIENVVAGNYLLQLSFIGYDKEFRTVNVPAQSDVGEILLSESANRLEEVVITGRGALVEQRRPLYSKCKR